MIEVRCRRLSVLPDSVSIPWEARSTSRAVQHQRPNFLARAKFPQTFRLLANEPPQVEFLDNPKPFTFEGREARLEITARIISTRPLVLDVLDLDTSMKRESEWSCGSTVLLRVVDAKLKPVLPQLKFNQVVKANLFHGGNSEYPDEVMVPTISGF